MELSKALEQVAIQNPEAALEFAQMLKEQQRRISRNKIASYRPYPKQMEFHNAGADHRERLLMAGNQLGKCVTYQTLIDTTEGSVSIGELAKNGIAPMVWAWDGEKKVKAQATVPFRKPGWHRCYRITMSDGRWFEAADHHRILTNQGWVFVSEAYERLLAFSRSLLGSSSERDLSIRASDARSFGQRASNWLGHYSTGRHRYDGQPLWLSADGQFYFPSPDGVQPYSQPSWHSDDLGHRRTSIRQLGNGLPANLGDRVLNEGRSFGFLGQNVYTIGQRLKRLLQGGWQSLAGLVSRPQLGDEVHLHASYILEQALGGFPYVDENQIISIKPIGRKRVYDLTVETFHNYTAAGIVHHNTLAGAAEMAYHLTGDYPDWWEGRVFNHPILAMCGSESTELTRDGIQTQLIGPPEEEDEWGTGFIPGAKIDSWARRVGVPNAIDTVMVKHVSGGKSTLLIKSYDQKRRKWQSSTAHVVWFDEEPPMDIYKEGLTRTNATGGMVYLTFTPLLGMSDVVRTFFQDNQHLQRRAEEAAGAGAQLGAMDDVEQGAEV